MTFAMIFSMVLCFALTISVAVSIGLSAVIGMQVNNAPMLIAVKEMFNSINKFPLAAIPFFILAGNLMESGGISRRLVEFAKSLVGGVQGGLPMTCVLTCMIFAAVSGSSAATCATIGKMTLPELGKRGYPQDMVIGTLAGAGTLGLLIPPSIIMIVYGVAADVSIARLFIAGVIPGILLEVLFSGYIAVWALMNPGKIPPADARMSFMQTSPVQVSTRQAPARYWPWK